MALLTNTVLAVANRILGKLGLNASGTTIITATDANTLLVRNLLQDTVRDLVNEYAWPELQAAYSFTLVTGQANYALPSSINRLQSETQWNSTQKNPLYGPIDPIEWQMIQSGLGSGEPGQRFRIKGIADKQIYIDPTPTSSENGQVCVLEYVSVSGIRPKTWLAGLVFGAGTYCVYNGNWYSTAAGGTAGATPPTHTTGSASDGTVTWVYIADPGYNSIALDTDVVVIDSGIVESEVEWKFLESRKFDFGTKAQRSREQIELRKSALVGAGVQSFRGGRSGFTPITLRNYPVQDY